MKIENTEYGQTKYNGYRCKECEVISKIEYEQCPVLFTDRLKHPEQCDNCGGHNFELLVETHVKVNQGIDHFNIKIGREGIVSE